MRRVVVAAACYASLRVRAHWARLFMPWLLAFTAFGACAQGGVEPDDGQTQATLVFKLLHFVHWPNEQRIHRSGFNLCIGDDAGPLGQVMLNAKPQTWRHTPIKMVVVSANTNEWQDCHAVVGPVGDMPLTNAFNGLLTIGFNEDFVDRGGMVALVKRGRRFSFDVNLHQARLSGLYLEAPLVQLAHKVVLK